MFQNGKEKLGGKCPIRGGVEKLKQFTSRLYLCRAEHGTAGLSSAQAGTPLTSAKSPTRTARKELGLPLVASSSRTKLWLALAKSANTQPLQRRMISSAVAPKAVAPAWLGLGSGWG